MSNYEEQSEAEIKKILNFAENLRARIIIPSLELENFLNFQFSHISKKSYFHACTFEKTVISKSFRRAFSSMNKIQQALYYCKCVQTTLKEIYSTDPKQDKIPNEDENTSADNTKSVQKFEQFSILLKKQGPFKKWILSKVQLASQISVLRLINTYQELDLHHYIMRESKSKEKPAIVLESTDQMAQPTTIRFTNYYGTFEELKTKLSLFFDKALKEKIAIMLKKNRNSQTSFRSSIQTEINIPQTKREINQMSFRRIKQEIQQKPATLLLVEGKEAKSMRRIIQNVTGKCFPEHENKRLYSRMIERQNILSLSGLKDFQQVSKDIYFNRKKNITRRVFNFSQSDISYEWLVSTLNSYRMFKNWKPCLFSINLLAEFPDEKTKVYHEINLYKDYNEVDYVFLRHLFQINGFDYYVDKSINTEEYGRVVSGSRGWIEQCIWRFRKVGNQIQVLVQVQFGEASNKKDFLQMGIEYIGEVGLLNKYFSQIETLKTSTLKTINNINLFLFQDQSQFNGRESSQGSPEIKKSRYRKSQSKEQTQIQKDKLLKNQKKNETQKKIDKLLFPQFSNEEYFVDQSSSQDQYRDSQYTQTQFYSIQDQDSSSEDSINSNQQQISYESIQYKNSKELSGFPKEKRYLYFNHIVNLQQKNSRRKTKESTEENGHYIWKKQWKITDKGQLVNINQKQINVQSSVLKLVVKRMGRNILAGKSLLNISLPIEIFGVDSNLQRLCKSMAYGPRFLETAAQMPSPVQRMKRVICFALGFSICYIEMQKPFNPILGETYQGLIDGCPIYGEQICHHPPISTVLLKGRGYSVYANLQAKVDMGLNSASGINDGFVNVSFDNNDFHRNMVKFTSPPGQLSGLVVGQRKLTLIKKSYYIDSNNMLLGIVQWGSQKKKNEISINNDYFDGQIIKLKPNTDLSKLDKIKESQYEMVCSQIKGRWTDKVSFDDKVLFNIQQDGPYPVQQYPYPLESSVNYREDIVLRKKNDLTSAQQAKQRLEDIQRNDRKLRKMYQKAQ